MKDLVENRRRLKLSQKLRIGLLALRENGLVWFTLLVLYRLSSGLAERAFRRLDDRRRRLGLPGVNSRELNRAIWESWDWSAAGEEWTPSEEWKASVIRCVLERWIPPGRAVLEIGPGAGRWTSALLERARELTGVDISARCVELCREKFGRDPRAKFLLGSGRDLRGVPDASIEALWSFDVFVHIHRADVEGYADELCRVLAPGAVGVIHHGSAGGKHGGWRSDLTHETMLELLAARDFRIADSFYEWRDGDATYRSGLYEDVITVFEKPALRPAERAFSSLAGAPPGPP